MGEERAFAKISGLSLTALDPEFRETPHIRLDEVRAECPVLRDEQLGAVFLTRHDDVHAVLKNKNFGVDPRKSLPDAMSRLVTGCPVEREQDFTPSMLFADEPDHGRLRGLVAQAFNPRAIEAWQPEVERIADSLLDRVPPGEEIDFMAAFAGPLPTIIIARMLGVGADRQDDFKRWSDDLVFALSPVKTDEIAARVEAAAENMQGFFREQVAERRARPGDDLISRMIAARDAGDQLTDEQIVQQCDLLLTAGNVTTTDLIGNGMNALLDHPGQAERLRADPSLMENAVEEMLRYDSPVVTSARIPPMPAHIAGTEIEAGRTIAVSLAAANHDPDVYPAPHDFDIARSDTHHVAFGGGRRFCLGAPLARMEAQVAFGRLLARFPRMARGEVPPVRRILPGFRGFETLPVVLG